MKRSILLTGIFGLLTTFGLASWSESQEPVPVAQDPIQVQTRGPLHEAYAQPFDGNPEPGPLAPKAPPPPLPEDPPQQAPDIANSQWIPGYWAWDAERQDYLWISGVYRVAPQNRTYVPGYWSQTNDGWRWIAGFWSNPQQDVPYTPEPPATLDNGPNQPAPDDNSYYIPGNWIYRDSRFVWRPGYYAPIQDGRVWNPAHYVWTPNGYLFVDGYWDLPFDQRGLIFAPVYFSQPLWQNAGWRYQPNYVVGYNSFLNNAFIGLGNAFYFGNYYGPNYARLGYRPWYTGQGRYNSTFAQYGRQNYRNNPNWIAGVQQSYASRSAGLTAVPPRTLAQQAQFVNAKHGPALVTPVNQFHSNHVRLVNATPAQVLVQKSHAQQTHQVSVARQKAETAPVSAATRNLDGRALRLHTPTTTTGPQIINHTPKGPNLNATHVPQVVHPNAKTAIAPSAKIVNTHTAPHVNQPTHLNPTPRVLTPTITAPRVNQPTHLNPVPRVVQPTHVNPAPRIMQSAPHTIQPSAPRVMHSAPAPHIQHAAPHIQHAAPRVMHSAPAHSGGAHRR